MRKLLFSIEQDHDLGMGGRMSETSRTMHNSGSPGPDDNLNDQSKDLLLPSLLNSVQSINNKLSPLSQSFNFGVETQTAQNFRFNDKEEKIFKKRINHLKT